ncbi:hypothetical protein AB0H63_12115 [Micromonospora echinospora]
MGPAVVLDADLVGAVAQVEPEGRAPPLVDDPDLRLGSRQAAVDEHET